MKVTIEKVDNGYILDSEDVRFVYTDYKELLDELRDMFDEED